VKVLLVGSGGREHALAWKLARSADLDELHAAPGNPGIARLGSCHPVREQDAESLLGLAHSLDIDLVVVGPEAPLCAGVADELRHAGVSVFGPSAAAAQTAGKGVFVCRDELELEAALAAARNGDELVVEELLEGREVSVFALSDGANAVALPAAQDFKRIGDGDTGPNTGGMGAFAPAPGLGPDDLEDILDAVHRPVLAELAARGAPFVGALYAGLMLTEDGPRVIEFNCRFGDPETQALVPLLDDNFLQLLAAAAGGGLSDGAVSTSGEAAVTVVLAAGDYPEGRDAGSPISGIEEAEADGALVFHAGTAVRDGALVTNGGRILGVTAVGTTVAAARERAYAAADRISFPGVRLRRDVAATAAGEEARVGS
jgi:phosphoribosylamine--glycine ligase